MTRPTGKTLYAILGTTQDATPSQLEAAYAAAQRNLSEIVNHTVRQQRQQQLEEAYTLLSSPVRRSVYDASLIAGTAKGVEVPGAVSATAAVESPARDSHRLRNMGIALVIISVLVAVYWVWQQRTQAESYRLSFESAIQRGEEAEKALQAQLAQRPSTNWNQTPEEAAANEGKTPAEIESERIAKREREERERELKQFDYEHASEQQRAQYNAERKARDEEYERQREKSRQEQQQREQQREAVANVERDRLQMLNRLIAEKRYDEARALAKTSYELDRIKSLEKSGY